MARQEVDFAKELRERIAEYPERSLALAVLGGFAIGGGLSNRTSFQIILMVLEGVLGDRLIPAIVRRRKKMADDPEIKDELDDATQDLRDALHQLNDRVEERVAKLRPDRGIRKHPVTSACIAGGWASRSDRIQMKSR